MEAAETKPGTVVTFYSYKGGTGRSMALANVAWILASNGHRVLAIDWDLEAPGLHRFFAPFLRDKARAESEGVIDWVLNFAIEAATPVNSPSERSPSDGRRHMPAERLEILANILPYAVSLDYPFAGNGTIDFVSAGRQGPSYAARVGSLDWGNLYEKMGGGVFLDVARRKMKTEYTYVLIDSRTGVSDTSGVCTVQMPDILVICFTANNQSIEGAAAVAASVMAQSDPLVSAQAALPSPHRGPAKIFPVLTRVDPFEKGKLDRRQAVVRAEFNEIVEVLFPLVNERTTYRTEVEIPYVPFYAYEETLATFGDTPDNKKVLAALERLTYHISNRAVTQLKTTPNEEHRLRILAEYEGQSEPASSSAGPPRREARFDVYVSYAKSDRPAATELARRLKSEGIEPWHDELNLRPGDDWRRAIETVLNEVASVAVFLGPSGLGPWQGPEVDQLLSRYEASGRPRLIPVLLPGADPRELPKRMVRLKRVEFQSTLDNPEAIRRLVQGIRGEEADPSAAGVSVTVDPPYRGLEAFGEKDARFFFGRAKEIEEVIERFRAAAGSTAARAVWVVGPSGSGKSSLVLAGLIPRLRQGALEGSASWPVAVFRPGAEPMQNLAAALAPLQPGPAPLSVHADPIAEALTHIPSGLPLVIVADQFDEVFSVCKRESERRALIELLVRGRASPTPGGRAIVVATMRDAFLRQGGIARFLEQPVIMGPMTLDEMRQAIERPAQIVGCELEAGLVELVLRDVNDQAGALPLLQFTLLELWRRRAGRRLTVAAYRDIGGITGALERSASQLYATLSPREQETCRRVLLAMVRPAGEELFVRRSVLVAPLVGDDPENAALTRSVIDRLADARLVTISLIGAGSSQETVELAHDGLIRGWTVLRRWVDEDIEGLRTRERLIEAAQAWERNGRDPRSLYRGEALNTAVHWHRAYLGELGPLEFEFLAASELQSRGSPALLWFRFTLRFLDRALAAIPTRAAQVGFVLSVVALCLLGYFAWSRHSAATTKIEELAADVGRNDQALKTAKILLADREDRLQQALATYRRTEAMRLAALSQNALKTEAVLLATEAFLATTREKEPPVPAAEQALRDALGDSGYRVLAAVPEKGPPLLAFSRDGSKLATPGADGIKIWDLTAPNPAASPLTLATKARVTGLALAPDARYVVIGGEDGTVSFAENRPNADFKLLGKFLNAVRALAVNSDFQLVVVDDMSVARMWTLLDPAKPPDEATGIKAMLRSVFINAERRQVAAGAADGRVLVYSPDSRAPRPQELAFDGPVNVLAISPDVRLACDRRQEKRPALAPGSGQPGSRVLRARRPRPARHGGGLHAQSVPACHRQR